MWETFTTLFVCNLYFKDTWVNTWWETDMEVMRGGRSGEVAGEVGRGGERWGEVVGGKEKWWEVQRNGGRQGKVVGGRERW
jgi:hypothetical protein